MRCSIIQDFCGVGGGGRSGHSYSIHFDETEIESYSHVHTTGFTSNTYKYFNCIHGMPWETILHDYRQLMGEELSGLGVRDLQGLENRLEMSLRSIKTKKVITCVIHQL